jgi:hypothetical protein
MNAIWYAFNNRKNGFLASMVQCLIRLNIFQWISDFKGNHFAGSEGAVCRTGKK